jgi:hypothetical protein
MKRIFSFLTVLVFTFAMFACNNTADTAAETEAEQVEEAGDAIEEAADEVEEAADEAADSIEEAADTLNNEM